MPPYSIGDRVQPCDPHHLWRIPPRCCRVLDLRPSRLEWDGKRRPIVVLHVEGFKSLIFQWAADFELESTVERQLEQDLDRLPEPKAKKWRVDRDFVELH